MSTALRRQIAGLQDKLKKSNAEREILRGEIQDLRESVEHFQTEVGHSPDDWIKSAQEDQEKMDLQQKELTRREARVERDQSKQNTRLGEIAQKEEELTRRETLLFSRESLVKEQEKFYGGLDQSKVIKSLRRRLSERGNELSVARSSLLVSQTEADKWKNAFERLKSHRGTV